MHFGLIAPSFPSHVSAIEAIAEALVARGHRATLVHRPDVRGFVGSPALGFAPVGERTHPPGSLAAVIARAARPGGPFGIRRVVADMVDATDLLCREAPAVLSGLGVDAVVTDQMEAAGGLVAEHLGVPFVSVACALPVNREPAVPLPVLSWPYDPSERGLARNRGGEWVSGFLMKPHEDAVAAWAERLGVRPRRRLDEGLSPLADVVQLVRRFDFPRTRLPPHVHYVGPFRRPGDDHRDLPFESSGRPLVFCSLGTLQGGRARLLRTAAKAARSLGAEVLVAHCGLLSDREAARIPADHVVAFAPQRAVIARAAVIVTHGGLNTVMDALSFGVPMLVLPIAFDQPGMAARVRHAGVGLVADHRLLTASRTARALHRLLSEDGFRSRARAFADDVATAGGAERAADIILQAVRTGSPVRAEPVPS
ncbi:glycosyltransferase [Chthonobacter rhizosphaerae]|uniref:glycosyltransferase n=1 Tax=Chthonobacter rhizosphaerae TaxID=2735553 RepID=UPI001AED6F86|nr:glycosyltransferase [Chthonobacter rhizosphaerae]